MTAFAEQLSDALTARLDLVAMGLGVVVLALAAVIWLWARRASRLRHELATLLASIPSEPAAGTPAVAPALAVAAVPEATAPPEAAAPETPATPELAAVPRPAALASGAPAAAAATPWLPVAAAVAAPPTAPAPGASEAALALAAVAEARPLTTPRAVRAGGHGAGAAGAVLLVEDDDNVARAYQLLLESRGYGVRRAVDGLDGLEQARAERPDLILVDLMMPRMNGLILLERLRQDDELSAVPAVVLSNFREPRLVERALALGAVEYASKSQTGPYALLSALPHWMRREVAVGS